MHPFGVKHLCAHSAFICFRSLFLVTKWEELPVCDFNSFSELVIINYSVTCEIVLSACLQKVGLSYVGTHLDNIRILCLIYTKHKIGILCYPYRFTVEVHN